MMAHDGSSCFDATLTRRPDQLDFQYLDLPIGGIIGR